MSDIKIVQLTDRSQPANPITPYVPASAVYYQYTDGNQVKHVNMETVYGGIDVNEIVRTQNEAVSAITQQASDSVNMIIAEGESYQRSIEEMEYVIGKLEVKAYPLEAETSLSGNPGSAQSSQSATTIYTYSLSEYDLPASGATVSVKRKANNGDYDTRYSGGAAEWSETSNMFPGTETYWLSATKGEKKVDKYDVRHLWFYGSYESEITSGETMNRMDRMFTEGGDFTVTITTSQDNSYLWFIVPKDVSVEDVYSDGIEVPTEDVTPSGFKIGNASYKTYRNTKPLIKDVEWKINLKLVD